MRETTHSLDYSERWLRDGLGEAVQAGCIEGIDVDVSKAAQILEQLKKDGRAVTWTHVFVRSVALTLARNPDLHQLVAGDKRIHPDSVDICLSIAGESSVTPVVIIDDTANKDIFAIAAEVARRSPEAVLENEQLLAVLRQWGWIFPLAILRRGLIRFMLRRLWYRRKVSGTFQVSCLPEADVFAPLLFNTVAALGVGRVRDRVIAVDGKPAVRPVVTLTCCMDHTVWNGKAAARFLTGVRAILESGDFAPEDAVVPQLPEARLAPVAEADLLSA